MRKKKKSKNIILIALAILLVLAASWGWFMSRVEQAKYTVVESFDNIEIRKYEKMIVAEAKTSGTREAAINQGFRIIADYIFGNNIAAKKIDMTAPVTQQSEKVAMTAPVMQQAAKDKWIVHFVMPAEHTLKTLPKPVNSDVKIKEVPEKTFVVIRFSGRSTDENLGKNLNDLNKFVKEKKLKTSGDAIFAFFNPPWTLPFLKRNEIMLELKSYK
jgi:effector-binding domain-containing protein